MTDKKKPPPNPERPENPPPEKPCKDWIDYAELGRRSVIIVSDTVKLPPRPGPGKGGTKT